MDISRHPAPLRILGSIVVGAVGALLWLVASVFLGSTSAAASPTDGSPLDGVTELVGSVTTPVAQALAPVTAPVAQAVAPVTAPVTQALAPVVQPVVAVVAAVATPLAPVVAPLVSPVAPLIDATVVPLLPDLSEALEPLGATTPTSGPEAPGGDAAVIGAADVAAALTAERDAVSLTRDPELATSAALSVAFPSSAAVSSDGGVPGPLSPDLPWSPAVPTGQAGTAAGNPGAAPAAAAELSDAYWVAPGLAGVRTSLLDDDLPSSPTFPSDTTPD